VEEIMIVITKLIEKTYSVTPGDLFSLTITSDNFEDTVIQEEINYTGEVNFIASFRFADDKGRCIGFNLCGFFGVKEALPREIREAKKFEDLTSEQKKNFIDTCGTILQRS
jgi:hypothetical protein